MAHQYITQMVEPVRDAVFGNVGTMVFFRVGAADAEFLEKEFTPEFMVNDLVNLGFKQIYLKLMIDGLASRPFSADTLPPIERPQSSYRDKIIKVSRERYSHSRKEVEEKIAKWSGVIEGEKEEKERLGLPTRSGGAQQRPAQSSRSTRDEIMPTFLSKCWKCGREVHLTFKPDGVRPIYCKECLFEVRKNPATIRENIQPNPSKTSSEILIKDTGQPVSLAEAAKKEPAKFSETRRKRKEVDLSDLRETLKEALKIDLPEAEKKEQQEEKTEEEIKKTGPKEDIKEESPLDSKNGTINPGETVEL